MKIKDIDLVDNLWRDTEFGFQDSIGRRLFNIMAHERSESLNLPPSHCIDAATNLARAMT